MTERHRRAQLSIRAGFLAQFVPLWPLLSWTEIDRTTPGWVRAVMRLVRAFRQQSAEAAEVYYHEFRAVEAPPAARLSPPEPIRYIHAPEPLGGPVRLPSGRNTRLETVTPISDAIDRVIGVPTAPSSPLLMRPAPVVDAPVRVDDDEDVPLIIDWSEWDKAAERSLLVTGPNELKRQSRLGRTERQARDNGLVTASGSASRHVLAGGRQANLTLVQSDKDALGWARVTDGDPCAFCSMLSSRGPVYKSAATAGFKAHDHCACSAEAVYSRRAAWPGRAREFRDLWDAEIAGKYSGKDALNAWRRLLAAQKRAEEFDRFDFDLEAV